jgi:hypothetical protein
VYITSGVSIGAMRSCCAKMRVARSERPIRCRHPSLRSHPQVYTMLTRPSAAHEDLPPVSVVWQVHTPSAVRHLLLVAFALLAYLEISTNHCSCDDNYARALFSLIDVVSTGGGRGPAHVHHNDGRSRWSHCGRRLHPDDLDSAMFHDQNVQPLHD